MSEQTEMSDADKLRMIAERVMGWKREQQWPGGRGCIRDDTGTVRMWGDTELSREPWNPLTSDSDAAELRRRLWEMGWVVSSIALPHKKAVQLEIDRPEYGENMPYLQTVNVVNYDPIAAERRALVDAAAEVAKARRK